MAPNLHVKSADGYPVAIGWLSTKLPFFRYGYVPVASGVATGWQGWTMSRGPRAKGAPREKKKKKRKKEKKETRNKEKKKRKEKEKSEEGKGKK